MKIKTLFAILAISTTTACFHDESDDSNEVPDILGKSANQLTAADFQMTDYTILDRYDAEDEIHFVDEFANDTSGNDTLANEASDGGCFGNAVGDPVIQSGYGGKGKFQIDLFDLTNCVANDIPGLTDFAASILFDDIEVTDSFGNPVVVVGKKLSEVGDGKIINAHFRFIAAAKGTFTDSGRTYPYSMKMLHTTHDSAVFEKGCPQIGNISGCTITNISRFNVGQEHWNTITNLASKGDLYRDITVPYFYGGTIDFQVNNWTGTMQYGSTGNDAPTYSATYGGNTIQGTYTTPYPKPGVPVKQSDEKITLSNQINNLIKLSQTQLKAMVQ